MSKVKCLFYSSILGLISLIILACDTTMDTQLLSEKMDSEKLDCSDSAPAEFNEWGKSGLSLSCRMNHGKVVGWDYGRKVMEGNYYYGKKQGEWHWFDEKGVITKTIIYDDGKEVSLQSN